MSKSKDSKYKNLLLGFLFDAIGMLSFAVPFIGDFSDIIWAPIAAWLMIRMYKGRAGSCDLYRRDYSWFRCNTHIYYHVVVYACI